VLLVSAIVGLTVSGPASAASPAPPGAATGKIASTSAPASATTATATALGPVYPPPGNVTLTALPNKMVQTGGEDWSFALGDLTQVSALWWGPAPALAVAAGRTGAAGLDADGVIDPGTETMTFDASQPDLGIGKQYWSGSFILNATSYASRLVITVTDSAGTTPIPLVPASSIPGIQPAAGAVAPISADFKVNLTMQMQVTAGGAWSDPVTWYDALGAGHPVAGKTLMSSFDGGFWYVGTSFSARSTGQYTLANSDGVTWTEIDPALRLTLQPTFGQTAVVGGNADLFTANAGFNQDIGIFMSDNGAADSLLAWKESGGFAGIYSPNAAFVQAVVNTLQPRHTYVIKLKWKTNRPAPGALIYAGAGPINSAYSPTRVTAKLVPASTGYLKDAVSTTQYTLTNNDGASWVELDPALRDSVTATADVTVTVGANADLFTANAGYNQDIAIFLTDNGGADSLVAWKESGGFAGIYSPNAAFVSAAVNLTSGHTYVFKLKWKTNRPASGAIIYAGAGPINAAYSPTRLTVLDLPTTANPNSTAVSTSQYTLANSDGATWTEISQANLRVTMSPAADTSVIAGANVDLFTANAGYNQDVGLFMAVDTGADQLLAWKESGGFAGIYSPNAAYLQTMVDLPLGHTYVFKLKWKTNRPAGGSTIYAGAGPINSAFSPTRVTLQVTT